MTCSNDPRKFIVFRCLPKKTILNSCNFFRNGLRKPFYINNKKIEVGKILMKYGSIQTFIYITEPTRFGYFLISGAKGGRVR